MIVQFYAAFEDGLLLMQGHAFEFKDRLYVVHKGREPFERDYYVSDMRTGFAVHIPKTRNRQVAIKEAKAALASMSERALGIGLKAAEEKKASLKIIG
jgi:hypothetical protein